MVVASSSAFFLVTGIFGGLYTIPAPQTIWNIFACAADCVDHEACGGFLWDKTQDTPCQFVVDSSVAGASESSETAAYRLARLRDKLLLDKLSPPDIAWQDAADTCLDSPGGSLIPLATGSKEKAQIRIRKRETFYIDLKRSPDGSYLDSFGAVQDISGIQWSGVNPHGGDELCLGGGYTTLAYFDTYCESNDGDPYCILCIFDTNN